jgi:Ferritin-like
MSPHLVRPNMPHPAHHYPPGVTVTLLPFGEAALRHFLFLERPEGMNVDDSEAIAASQHAVPHMDPDAIAPVLQRFATVGHLYRSIEAGLRRLVEKWGEARVFVGPARAQAKPEHFRWPEVVEITDLNSAVRAIETIVEQGEGPRGAWKTAHFGRFKSVLDEYLALKAIDPAFEPTRPVLAATVWPTSSREVPRISDHDTARVADLFNVAYEILLQVLSRFFNNIDESDEQRGVLADVGVGIMFEVVSPLGAYLTELPAGPEHPGRTAGPTFELFYTSDYLLPHRRAAWLLLEERLREAAAFSRRLKPAEPLERVSLSCERFADLLRQHGD